MIPAFADSSNVSGIRLPIIDQHGGRSIVVSATEVITALGAHQLAMMACETMAAGGADLAMVIDRSCGIRRGLRTTLRDACSTAGLKVGGEVRDEVGVKGTGTLGQHG
jgi:hypothetical protein